MGWICCGQGGVEALVKIQAQEWEMHTNLRINALIPGVVHTSQRTKTHPGEIKQNLADPKDIEQIFKQGRIGFVLVFSEKFYQNLLRWMLGD